MRTSHWSAPFAISVVLLAAAFAARVIGLGDQSLWYDEGYTVMLAQRSADVIIRQVATLDFNTPLHYLLLGAWMQAGAGTTEFAARLFFVSADLLSVALAYRLARLAGLRQTAWLPLALAGTWLVAVYFAREARMYALLSLFTMLAITQLLANLRLPSARGWLLWALWNACIVSTHILGATVIAAQLVLVGVLWISRRYRITPSGAAGLMLSAAAVLSWVLFITSIKTVFTGFFPERLNIVDWVVQGFASLSLPRQLPEALVAPAALLGAAALMWIIARGKPALRVTAAVLVLSVLFTAVFIALVGKGSYRYTGYLSGAFAVVLGAAIATHLQRHGFWRLAARIAIGGMLVGSAAGLVVMRTSPAYQNEDFRGAAAHLRTAAAPDEQILLVSGHLSPVFAYYYGADGWSALPPELLLDLNHALDYESAVPLLNSALTGKHGAWVLLWQDDLIDPTGIVPTLLGRIAHGLTSNESVPQFKGLRVLHYRFDEPYALLPERLPEMHSRIEPVGSARGLSGLGCAQLRSPRSGDTLLEVLCFWQLKPYVLLPYDMQVSLRLLGADGKQIAQSDQQLAPVRGLPYIPFEKPITSVYFIPIAAELEAGVYTLRAIPYLPGEEVAPQVVTPVRVLSR